VLLRSSCTFLPRGIISVEKKNKNDKKDSETSDQKFVSKRVTPPKNNSVPSSSRRPKPPGKNRSGFVQKKNKPNQ
jgi:hypothetical protein